MRAKAIGILALVSASLVLSGCVRVRDSTPIDGGPKLLSEVVPPLTVVLDARAFNGSEYDWDFGDGTTLEGGPGLLSHTYQDPGRYVVIAVAMDPGTGGAEGRPGCGPSIGRRPPGGETGAEPSDSAYVIVDLENRGDCNAVIIAFRNGKPTTAFWHWDSPVFWAGGSGSSSETGVWYGWIAERVYRQWKPGHMDGDTWVPAGWTGPWVREETARHTGEYWEPGSYFFRVPMHPDSGTTPDPLYYDITLLRNDGKGNHCETVLRLSIHNYCK